MNRFIRQILIFTLPIVLFFITLELILINIPNDFIFKRDFMDLNSDKIEVLILGNSHTYYGINPYFINKKTFNLAYPSQPLNYDFLLLKKYEKSLKKLKYLILPIDYCSLYYKIENGSEKWRSKNYSIYYGLDSNLIQQDFEILHGRFSNNISRAFNFFFHNKTDLSCNKFGFGYKYNSKFNKNLFSTGIQASKRHSVNIYKNHEAYSNNFNNLNLLIDIANKNKINLIFISSPAYVSYYSNLNEIQLKYTHNTILNLCKMNNSIYYFDFLKDSSFIANDFFDADHLNEIGAKKLSIKIDSIIRKIEFED